MMNRSGNQLLASAGLTKDENVRVARSDLSHHLDEVLHYAAFADSQRSLYPLLVIPFEIANLILKLLSLKGSLYYHSYFSKLVWLGDVVVRSFLHRLDGGIDSGVGSNHNNFRVRILFLGSDQDVHTVDLFHLEVGDHDIKF